MPFRAWGLATAEREWYNSKGFKACCLKHDTIQGQNLALTVLLVPNSQAIGTWMPVSICHMCHVPSFEETCAMIESGWGLDLDASVDLPDDRAPVEVHRHHHLCVCGCEIDKVRGWEGERARGSKGE